MSLKRLLVRILDPESNADGSKVVGISGGKAAWVSPTGVPTSRQIIAGTGLTGGGDLTADRTLAVDLTAETERVQDVVGAMVVAGSNITVVYNDPAGTLTISSTGGSGGAGELLMQDGVTAPPVPIENEARSDWLYSG